MPRRTYQTKADYDAEYDVGFGPVRLGYCRASGFGGSKFRAENAVQMMNWAAPGPAIVVVGCGFGWFVEALEGMGFTSVVGIDKSAYVHQVSALTEEAEIDAAIVKAGLETTSGRGLAIKTRIYDPGPISRTSRPVMDEDALSNRSQKAIERELGASPEFVVTEHSLEALEDAEITAMATSLRSWGAPLVHIVTPRMENVTQDPVLNWHTGDEYKALLPADTIITVGDWKVYR